MQFSKKLKIPREFERLRREIFKRTLVKTFNRNQAGVLNGKIWKNDQNPGGLSPFKIKKSEKSRFFVQKNNFF